MNRLIFGSSLVCVLFLLIGSYVFPNNIIMWFAGTTINYTIFRIVMTVALITVLCTNPPRSMYMRLFMGGLSLILVGFGLWLMYTDVIHVLDMVLFLLLGVTFAIEALEFNEDELSNDAIAIHANHIVQVEANRVYLSQEIIALSIFLPSKLTMWKPVTQSETY